MNRPKVTSRPRTAMELAFNKAVQEHMTKPKAPVPPPQPPDVTNTKKS